MKRYLFLVIILWLNSGISQTPLASIAAITHTSIYNFDTEFYNNSFAPCNPIITTGSIIGSTFCAGNQVSVPFTLGDCVDAGNVFTAQLSNAVGLFTSPINIGSLTSTGSGIINATIPVNTSFGNGYRIRVVSSLPTAIGTDNGNNITITPTPQVGFNINITNQCLNGNQYLFSNTSTGSIGSHVWTFGDGSGTFGTNPAKAYTSAGTFFVKLITTGINGCKDSIIKPVVVQPKPTVAFTLNNANACTNTNIIQANTSSISSGTLSYFWDFGDGTNSVDAIPTKAFIINGNYNIKLIVTSNLGCKDSLTQNISINSKPTAAFTLNNAAQCLNGNNFNFTNNSTGIFNGVLWSFGDGITSTNNNPNYTYSIAGNYTIKLLINTLSGCRDSITQTIAVNPKPTVSFVVNSTSLCTNSAIINANTSSISSGTQSYFWDFGDGTTSTSVLPNKVYATPGNFTIKLVATSNNGCKDSLSQNVTILAKPTTLFNTNNTAQCLNGNSFSFTNNSTGTINNVLWSFGDGSTSSLNNPIYSYTVAGNYGVKLLITSTNGCRDSIIQNIVVNPKPEVSFVLNNSSSCTNGNVIAADNTNISSGTVTYFWDFGDGTNSNLSLPSKIYTVAGNYIIKLVATSNNGCKDSSTQNINVLVKPTASFSVNSTSQCLQGNNFIFTNTSTGAIASQTWYFGNGSISNLLNPSFTYPASGNYAVKLVVVGINGCKDSSTITVTASPVPNFSINQANQCFNGNSFSFINSSLGNILNYAWSFGDGNTSTLTNPFITYTTPGSYTVKLLVTEVGGCKDSITKVVNVFHKPNPAFSINTTFNCIGSSFDFTNTSSIGSGTINYTWSFGDGTFSSNNNPSKSYTIAGNYTVKLLAISNNGCRDSITQNITVLAKPTAAFTINNASQCINGNNFIFTNSSIGSIANYNWSFGDGNTASSLNSSNVYNSFGTYPVKLMIVGTNGCRDSITQNVNVFAKPIVNFAVSPTPFCLSSPLQFNNLSSIGAGSNIYNWSFGDGTNSTNISPSKSFSTIGTFTTKLIAISDNGCKDSSSQNITILPKPSAAFTINNNAQCINVNNVVFTNNSTGAIAGYNWSFGDGSFETITNPSKIYTTFGNNAVKLIANGINGCKDSITQNVTIHPKPNPSYSVLNSSLCQGVNFQFNNTSSVANGSITYVWNFGDATTSNALNPLKSYTTNGNFPIKLVVTSDKNCKDSITQNVTVLAKPIAAFSVNNTAQCLVGNSFSFTNNSTGTIASQQWFFADGTSASTFNATKNYTTSGTYSVKLIVTGSNGCKDSITQTINVFEKPTAAFFINSVAQCINGNNFIFTNNSAGAIAAFNWSFGEGTTSSSENPSKAFLAAGVYPVKLVVTSNNGCKDSISQNVSVFNKPNPSFTFNTNNQCVNGNNYVFTNTSTGIFTNQEWIFGDGSTSTGLNASKTYATAGTFLVKLILSNTNGCRDSTELSVTVLPKPTATFSINSVAQCLNGNNFIFSNTSTAPINSSFWDFGNGNTATTNDASTTYSTVGNFNVKLVTTGASGCKDSITQQVTILPKPIANYNVNLSTQCQGNSFSFTNTSTSATSYSWNFGEGTTTSATNPSIAFAFANTFNVKLVAINSNGCRDSITKPITVLAKPTTGFIINNISQCLVGNNFVFNNTSSGSIANYIWDFGDGSTTTTNSPTFNYSTAGIFAVKLVATGVNGCKDSTTQNVTVFNKPTPTFTINNTQQCINSNSFVFTNNSMFANNYIWNFGDGTTSTLTNPTKNYLSPGTYTVKLIAINSTSCRDSISQIIVVNDLPSANFAINNSTQCLNGNNFIFTNTSIAGNTYTWFFGDGTFSNTLNVSKTYSNAGVFTVKLVTTNLSGCKDSVSTIITVQEKPIVNFNITGNTSCTSNFTLSFSNTTINATNYTWDFGDGTSSTLQNPTKTYATGGSYLIKLVATSINGCRDSLLQNFTLNTKPIASFTTTTLSQCLGNNNFQFNNSSTGNIASYFWDFGDGITSPLQSPTKAYAVAGTYNVKMVVTGINGCKDSVTQTVSVSSKPVPNFNLVGFIACSNNTSITLNNSSTGAVNYVWDFGDGTSSTLTNPSKTYASIGAYTIKLIAINSNGCRDSVSQVVTISTKPIASFTTTTLSQCLGNNNFQFNNSSTGNIASYFWDFGDGITSPLQSPTKAYAVAGTYNVKMVVTGINGCKDSVTQTVSVSSKPVPNFNLVGFIACSNNTSITLNNSSTGAVNYVWDFGDGTSSTLTNPSKTYTSIGAYTIKLIVINSNGCRDSVSQVVNISTKPIASFTTTTLSQCLGNNNFQFNNSSTGNIASYFWDFGDGITSPLQSPTKAYAVAGTYNVKMVVTGINGCKDSVTQTVSVSAKPVPNFNLVGFIACSNNTSITLNNSSTGAVNYVWDFGDGTSSTLTNPSKTYTSIGAYTIKLIAINSNGCRDSVSNTIVLASKPTASYTLNSTNICVGSSINFTNTSIISGAAFHYWDFGDGTNSQVQNPTKQFTTAGTFVVKYFLTNAQNCKDSLFTTVIVNPKPTVFFNIQGANSCTNNLTFNFVNTSGTTINNWTFSDGTTSTDFGVTKTFPTFGTYVIKLVAGFNTSCLDSFSTTFTITPKPIAQFTVSNSTQCLNANQFIFNNTSSSVGRGALTYYWTFGDGTISQDFNPTKTYINAGTYLVKLFVTNALGCKDSTESFVTVTAKPNASFTFPNNACTSNNSFSFSNTSSNATSYLWDFGDGTQSSIINPTKVYTVLGTFRVKLIAYNASGCLDSVSQIISMNGKPIASFNVLSNLTNCSGNNSYSMSNTSTNLISPSYLWDFGDGNISTLVAPQKSYLSAGIFKVKLTITNLNGCTDTAIQFITVVGKPTVTINSNNFNQCINSNNFNFNANASTGAISNYNWSFGDNTFSSLPNPTKVYTNIGNYVVKLIYTTAAGCIDSIQQVASVNPPLQANFVSTVDACNQAIIFTNASVGAGNLIPYTWYFGNGTTSQVANPGLVSYNAPGLYNVKLVFNGRFCSDSITKQVLVAPKAKASFSLNNYTPCTTNNVFTFNNTSTGNISNYFWDFGDNTFSTLVSPLKVYTSQNFFTIKLIILTAEGCRDSVVQTINLSAKPIPSFTTNTLSQCVGTNNFVFTNTTSGATNSYLWNFGDGSFSGIDNPTKSYSNNGTFIVKLFATNTAGCSDSTTRVITVNPQANAVFTINNASQCLKNNLFTFTSLDPLSVGNSYSWDFGDGNFSAQQNITKVYTAEGIYPVKLKVTNAFGCVETTVQNVTVFANATASFNTINTNNCTNNLIQFTNTTVGSGFNYFWSFGDGTISTDINPSKTYTIPGIYTIKLLAINALGCRDSAFRNITITGPNRPLITATPTSFCSYTYNFTTTPFITGTTYLWNFGDGTTSTLSTPTKTYSTSGVKNIVLTVTDAAGCSNSTTQSITLITKPQASFTISTLNQCLTNNSFSLINTSFLGDPTTTFIWNFGDGTTSTLVTPIKSYSNAGTYNISLVARNISGCNDSVITTVKVNPIASAVITGSQTICSGLSTNLNFNFVGTPPFNVTYTDGSNDFLITNILTNGLLVSVSPLATTNYRIKSFSDAGVCPIVTSNITGVASILVNNSTLITQQPSDTGACIGGSTQLSVLTGGTGTIRYQWRKNGVDIVGERSSTLTFNNLQASDVASYSVVVTSDCGSVLSSAASVVIGNIPSAPTTVNNTICKGTVAIPLTATGINLVWHTAATGGTSSLVAPTPSTTTVGTQIFFVSSSENYCQSARTPIITTIIEKPIATISINPANGILPGQVARLTASVNPILPITSYRWFYKGVLNSLTTSNFIDVDFSKLGFYKVEASIPSACLVTSDSLEVKARAAFVNTIIQKKIFIVPNPVKDIAGMYFDAPINETVTIRLVDTWGRIRQSKVASLLNAFQRVDFDVKNMIPGMYAIEVINSRGVSIARNILYKIAR